LRLTSSAASSGGGTRHLPQGYGNKTFSAIELPIWQKLCRYLKSCC